MRPDLDVHDEVLAAAEQLLVWLRELRPPANVEHQAPPPPLVKPGATAGWSYPRGPRTPLGAVTLTVRRGVADRPAV